MVPSASVDPPASKDAVRLFVEEVNAAVGGWFGAAGAPNAWCAWTVAAAIAIGVAVASGWLAYPSFASAPQVPDLETTTWWLAASGAMALLASLAGGLRGARAEARILGGWSPFEVTQPFAAPEMTADRDSYYEEEPLVIRSAGLPGGI
jgi:hypothetical protein